MDHETVIYQSDGKEASGATPRPDPGQANEPKAAKGATGEVSLSLPQEDENLPKKPMRRNLTRWIGNFLIVISLVGIIITFFPILLVEVNFKIQQIKGTTFSVDKPPQSGFGSLLNQDDQPTLITPVSTEFAIVVEKIGANSVVVPNVDASDPAIYNQALKKGVAQAAGSAMPGQNGISFLFAHSTLNPWDVPRYNAVFYLLRTLEIGDRVIIYYQGRRFNYAVYDKQIVGANDVGFLRKQYNESVLVLQTCDPPGTTWKRLLIFARPEVQNATNAT
ncbi:MAG TPA: sortase [Patescibacteria group bacterium]